MLVCVCVYVCVLMGVEGSGVLCVRVIFFLASSFRYLLFFTCFLSSFPLSSIVTSVYEGYFSSYLTFLSLSPVSFFSSYLFL